MKPIGPVATVVGHRKQRPTFRGPRAKGALFVADKLPLNAQKGLDNRFTVVGEAGGIYFLYTEAKIPPPFANRVVYDGSVPWSLDQLRYENPHIAQHCKADKIPFSEK